MDRARFLLLCIAALLSSEVAKISADEAKLHVFGYTQNSFQHNDDNESDRTENSFALQQLNLFLRKPLSKRWTSFVSFEMVNNYSSFRHHGAFNLEEAWVKYRFGKRLNLKIGLQIPIFNNFNEIKNRTPLMPYVIRPLVYETSFQEIISLEEFVPERAFVQAYGYVPAGPAKIDYAAYLGNSPNVNDDPLRDQTGLDTTATVLVGGRVGVRYGEVKLGLSATHDRTNNLQEFASEVGYSARDLKEVRRVRIGSDFSVYFKDTTIEAESILVRFDDDLADFKASLEFYFATVSYRYSEQLLGYLSYWYEEDSLTNLGVGRIKVPNLGVAYYLNDRIVAKGQYARADLKSTDPESHIEKTQFDFYAVAISVTF